MDNNIISKRRGRRGRVFLILLLIICLLIGALLIDSNTRIVTTEYELRYRNLPAGFDGYRIAVLSDVHASQYGEDNERLLSMVCAAQPDIIAITGDLIDGYSKPPVEDQIEIALTLASGLVKLAPVYYITGNHDWNSGAVRQMIPLLEECGVTVLRNKYTKLISGGDTVILAGTDDPNGPADMIKPDELVGKIRAAERSDNFIIMLEHRNNNLRLYSEIGVNLVLSGHAHGGVIRLPFTDGLFGPQRDLFPTYTSGVYTMGDTNLVVSRGVGNHTGLPRFLNNPEIVVVTLKLDSYKPSANLPVIGMKPSEARSFRRGRATQ